MRFEVWAPAAKRVDLDLGGRLIPMTAGEDGRFSVETTASAGADYAFRLDGGGPLPDPRSPWQPGGVNGPSRTVDHSAFPWKTGRWQPGPLSSAVIYEAHIGTFSPEGTFDGAIGKLDHLASLGVTHLELMPVAGFDGPRGWGYDGVDLWAPHHSYGGPDGLKRLVDACHARGLAVVLDVVYNHLGPSGNCLERFGPYLTDAHHSPWGKSVNLSGPGSDETRRFFIGNALSWLRDYRIDGLRLDAVHALVDTSAVHFLEELAGEVRRLSAELGRHLSVIAESDLNDPRLVRSPEAGGYGLDAQWSDDFHHALHAVLTGERTGYYRDFGALGDIAKALRGAFVYDGRRSAFRGRRHGRPAAGLSGHRFLGYLQNHDQVGNRATGDRSGSLMSADRLKAGAALVLASPFVPLLFQGEEWAASTPFLYFTSFPDPALGRAVSDGRRREFAAFGWEPQAVPDPQDPRTFLRSKLDWSEPSREPHAEVLAWHRKLIELRRRIPALADGRLDLVGVRFDEEARWMAVERGPVTVALNLAGRPQVIPLGRGRPHAVLLASGGRVKVGPSGIELAPDGVAVLGPEDPAPASKAEVRPEEELVRSQG